MFRKIPYWAGVALKYTFIVLVGFAVLTLLFSVGSLFGPDTGAWSLVNIDWDYGSIELHENAESGTVVASYRQSYDALYTKDIIKCSGHELSVDFPAGVTLTVYYFDVNDKYISSYVANNGFTDVGVAEIPEGAVGIRLCMLPDSNVSFETKLFGVGVNFGNAFLRWKYEDYVDLYITKAATIDNVNGI